MSQQNRAAIERLLQAFAPAPESAVGEHFTPDWVNHDPSLPPLQGLEGAAELVRDSQNGFVVESSPEAIAEAMVRLYDDSTLAERLGGAAQADVADLTWSRAIDRLLIV